MRHHLTNRFLLVVIAVCAFLSPDARAYEWDIGPWLAPVVGPAPVTLKFSGLWPDTCVPKIESTRLAGETLEIRTQSKKNNCRRSETLFSIPIQLLGGKSGAHNYAWLHRRENDPDYQLYGFRLADPGGFPVIEPSSGWWWPEPGGPEDSGGPGMGLTIDYQQGLLTIISQAYDAPGNPEWQLATGAVNGDVFNAPLILFSNGQTLTGSYQLPDLAMGRDELSLLFHSPLSATAWFSHRRGNDLDSPIDLRAVSMIRYLVNPPVLDRLLRGRWLVTSRLDTGARPAVANVRIVAIEQTDPEEIQLTGASGQIIGRCRLEAERPEAAPRHCILVGLAFYGDVAISSVSYDRMSGTDQSGRPVIAVRIPR